MQSLALAEWWHNSNFHSSIQMTPFEALYGYPPPIHVPYISGTTTDVEVDKQLRDKDNMLKLLRFHLHRSHHRMVQLANRKTFDRSFQIGDWVFVKLHPYRQLTVANRRNQKLTPLFYGPYRIPDKIGVVAYKLYMPLQSKVHPMFHVSKLKLFVNAGQKVSARLLQTHMDESYP